MCDARRNVCWLVESFVRLTIRNYRHSTSISLADAHARMVFVLYSSCSAPYDHIRLRRIDWQLACRQIRNTARRRPVPVDRDASNLQFRGPIVSERGRAITGITCTCTGMRRSTVFADLASRRRRNERTGGSEAVETNLVRRQNWAGDSEANEPSRCRSTRDSVSGVQNRTTGGEQGNS